MANEKDWCARMNSIWLFCRKIAVGLIFVVVLIISTIAARMLQCKDAFDETYRLKDDDKILVIGSSQAGCSFNRKDGYRILWVEASPPQIVMFRLQEFIARNKRQDNLRLVVTDFGPQTFCLQSKERTPRFWYREFPLTLPHICDMPCSYFDFLTFIVTNLQMPFNFNQRWDGGGRPSLADKSDEWKKEMLQVDLKSHYYHYADSTINFGDWKERTVSPYLAMQEICNQNNLRLVVLVSPTTRYYQESIPEVANAVFAEACKFLSDKGVCIVDLRTLNLDDVFFCDAIHLTEAGADRVGDAFWKEVKRMGVGL